MLSVQGGDANFSDFQLNQAVLHALQDEGYEKPSPIQAQAIPALLEGRDVMGQAQTGTGKTAAFSLPILSKIDLNIKAPQALILAPTRELALQVCDAIQRYGAHMKGLNVLPIYGGQSYIAQKRTLQKGVPIVVGTPGRVMDLIKQKCLDLSSINYLVLDEADEMLNMGFLEDVEWILNHTPENRQTVLFSATMPKPILTVARKHLRNPEQIIIKNKTATAQNIHQSAIILKHQQKLDALIRLLEVESMEAGIIFTRTIATTLLLAEKLTSLGFKAAALNGDMVQKQRERTVQDLKSGKLNIIVATDVAARGIDVTRVTHVYNFDMPSNPESYVHRIGRTGRAGRHGKAILFVLNHEKRDLKMIERLTKQPVEIMSIPGDQEIESKRLSKLKDKVYAQLDKDTALFHKVIQEICEEKQVTPMHVASALAHLVQGVRKISKAEMANSIPVSEGSRKRNNFNDRPRRDGSSRIEANMQRFRIEVGREHHVKPGNIVGAIANEIDLNSAKIGSIKIFDKFSTVDLPKDLSPKALSILENTWVAGQQLKLRVDSPPKGGKLRVRSDNKKFQHKLKNKKRGKR